MVKILANDGIDAVGKQKLEQAGIEVDTDNVPQDQLKEKLNRYDGVLVRSATKLRQDVIDACPNVKIIGRGGVGMDNIDVEYARNQGREVINTPAASSLSVAELVFAHLFSGARFLHEANRRMPSQGNIDFKALKKKYSKGIELRGKTLGIIGFGRIGQETARIALGLGMKVLAVDHKTVTANIELEIADQKVIVPIETTTKEEVLKNSDFISLHVPFGKSDTPVIGEEEFKMMKDGVFLVNCARGGCVDEFSLMKALDSGKVAFAGIDVFENEPIPNPELLQLPNVSLTPHIGASTVEAQKRIGLELADKVIHFFNGQ